ncbi:MAG: SDR family NAD(P)-dependent oxidoreductase [Dehalobacterium sp.]
MPGILKDKVAIVFGGTGHVGSAICEVLSAQGAKVIIHYHHRKEAANKIIDKIINNGGGAKALQADVTDEEAVNSLMTKTVSLFGQIDIIVNTVHREFNPILIADMKWEDWTVHIEALKGHFYICKSVLPYMRKQNHGHIVFISAGLSSRFFKGCSAFTTIKAGLNGFCKTLALEEGEHNITVNIVAPGRVLSNEGGSSMDNAEAWEQIEQNQISKTPLKRSATPDDVANAVLYFVSPGASCITGQTLFVAGGEVMPMP